MSPSRLSLTCLLASRWMRFALVALAAGFSFTGCHTPHLQNIVLGPDYVPGNVFKPSPTLPPNFRRVAVLPLACDATQVDALAGQRSLEPVLRTELLKLKRFELTWVAADDLARWTGKSTWDAQEKLPPNLFAKLREQLGCDGILFCRLSRFHAYPPITIGWNLKLVEANKGETLWAVDETFDAGEPAVSNSARRYEQQHQKGGPVTDSPLILSSPQRFGAYTLSAILSTTPTQ